jgi:hypothetical protein
MKNKFLNLRTFLIIKSLFLFILFLFLSYRNLSFNSFVLLAVFSTLFVQQIIIVLSEFKNWIRLVVWPLSYLVSLSFLINVNKEWFFLTWKYQLIIFLFILLNLFNLRFISKINKLLVFLAFVNSLVLCLFLGYTAFTNFEEPFYFQLAKGLTIFTIVFSIFISFSKQKTAKKIVESENAREDSSIN